MAIVLKTKRGAADGRSRVRTLYGLPAIQDSFVGRLRALLAGVFKRGELPHSVVNHRYVLRLGIVVTVESEDEVRLKDSEQRMIFMTPVICMAMPDFINRRLPGLSE